MLAFLFSSWWKQLLPFYILIMSWLIGLYNLDGSFYLESYAFNSEVQWVSSAEVSVQQFQRKASICYVCNLLKNPSRVSSHLKKKKIYMTGLIRFDTDIENAWHNRMRIFCHNKSDKKDRLDMLTNKLTLEFLLKTIQVFFKHFKSNVHLEKFQFDIYMTSLLCNN